MSATDVPVMQVQPRRMLSPHPAFAKAKVEPIHQPLYSCALFNDAVIPAEVQFFSYGIGGVVANSGTTSLGNVTATYLHTNMEQAGVLSQPKLFLIQGVRLVYPLLNAAFSSIPASDVTDVGASVPSTLLDNLKLLIYSTVSVVHVGTKDYIRTPTVNLPGNTGIGGIAAVGVSSVNEARYNVAGFMTAGKYYSLPTYPILIPSQQSFFAKLVAPQGTPPTLTAETAVYLVFDGILGRETQ